MTAVALPESSEDLTNADLANHAVAIYQQSNPTARPADIRVLVPNGQGYDLLKILHQFGSPAPKYLPDVRQWGLEESYGHGSLPDGYQRLLGISQN